MTTASYAMELKIARANTVALIEMNPTSSVINRPMKYLTEAGGYRYDAWNTLPAQRFMVVPLSGLVWNRSDPTPDEGRLPDVTEQVVGRWDMDIQKEDRIPWNNHGQVGYLLVVHVERDRHYRTSALTRFIQESGDG